MEVYFLWNGQWSSYAKQGEVFLAVHSCLKSIRYLSLCRTFYLSIKHYFSSIFGLGGDLSSWREQEVSETAVQKCS